MAFGKLTAVQARELRDLAQDFENARGAYMDALSAIRDDWSETMGGRSDKWRESDKGSDVQERLDTLAGIADEVEGIDISTGWIEDLTLPIG